MTNLRLKLESLFCSPWAMIVTGLALRLIVMRFTYTIQLVPMEPWRDHWAFGWETGRVARSIAIGQGFGSPYPQPTGPTAHLAPVYPYLLAGVFKLFGIYTASSALAILTINNLFSSLTGLPVFWIARRVFGLRVAVWAGWTWAFFPYSVALSNVVVWDTVVTTLLMTLLVLATLYLERSKSFMVWAGYGLLWGFTALTGTTTLSALPFLGAWAWFQQRRRGCICTGQALIASLVFCAVIAPWVWRCSQIYGRFVPIRGNFPLEVLVGNNERTRIPFAENIHPGESPAEMAILRRMGEPAYMSEKQLEVRQFITHHPLRFAGRTMRRILNVWTFVWELPPRWNFGDSGMPNVIMSSIFSLIAFTGLAKAILSGRGCIFPLAILPVCFPVIYYVTHPDIRYRHPIDPTLVIFFVYGAMDICKPRISVERNPHCHFGGVSCRLGEESGDGGAKSW